MRRAVATLAPTALLVLANMAQGQDAGPRLGTCLLAEDFEGGAIPAGWDPGAPVEQQDDQSGVGLGTFVQAWTVGTTPSIGQEGMFAVADAPAGNQFAILNDDGDPCNCDLSDAGLTTPAIDLTGLQHAGLNCRMYVDQRFGGGSARIQVSTDGGGSFTEVAQVSSTDRRWVPVCVDLSAYDGEPDLRIRFAWDDGGGWGVGIGLDDVCISTRGTHDLRIVDAWLGDASLAFDDPGGRSLPLSLMPLEQAAPITVSVVVENVGTAPATNLVLETSLLFDAMPQGNYTLWWPLLEPCHLDTLVLHTGWTPSQAGALAAEMAISANGQDEDLSDNLATGGLVVTGPGTSQGSSAWGTYQGPATRGWDNDSSGFITACRLEVVQSGAMAFGAAVAFAEGTQPGAPFRVELRDEQLSLLAFSEQLSVPDSAINPPGEAVFTYAPFEDPVVLPGTGDVFVGVAYAAAANELEVGVSGPARPGMALWFDNSELSWKPMLGIPMVRLHLDNALSTGPHPRPHPMGLRTWPVPTRDVVWFEPPAAWSGDIQVSVLDAAGRVLWTEERQLGPGGPLPVLPAASGLSPGVYLLMVQHGDEHRLGRFVVSGP